VSYLPSLRQRITAALAALLGLVTIMTLLGSGAIRSMNKSIADDLAAVLDGSEITDGLVSSVLGEVRAAQQYLLTPNDDSKREFTANGDSAYSYQRRFRSLRALTNTDRLIIDRIGATQAEVEVAYATSHALTDLGRTDESRALVRRAKSATDSLIGDVRSLAAAQAQHSMERAAVLRRKAIASQTMIWVLFVIAIVLGVSAATLTVRSVDLPLQRLISAARQLGDGDLRPVQLGDMPTELASLARAMETMAGQLREVVAAVVREAQQISSSAGDFSAMSQELAASSGEISSAMVKISGSADNQVRGMQDADALLARLRATAQTNAEAATRVVRLGEEIRGVATRHRTDVEAARSTLLDVREVVRVSAEQVNQLAKLSESITDFIDLIKQISSQTNLLALNAAIEAARAGEHGRGFAVVAEEVRHLADSSAKAAEDVTKTVEFIRAQIRDVTATMQVGTGKVGGIEHVAQGAATGLQEIGRAVQEVQAAAAVVAQEADQNRTVVDRLTERTAQVAQAATDHASSSEEVAAAAEEQSASTEDMAANATELLEGANRLTQLVQRFRT